MKKSLLFLLLLWSYSLIAQSSDYNFIPTAVLPPPVNAANINKGGDVSVNLSCGTPSVNIPLAEVKSRFLGFPVSINYASNGIRVNELASNIGLGWSLNCGGSVTRTTLGLPDEERGSYNTDFTNFTKTSLTPGNLDRAAMSYLQYKRDRESDVFSFSVNGFIQGKFILDEDMKPKLLNESNYKITMLSAKISEGFQIIDDKGIVFVFNVADTSTYERGDCGGRNDRTQKIVNSWHLTQIIKPYQDTIYFNYVDDNYSYLADMSENESVCITTGIGGCSSSTPTGGCPLFSSTYTKCFTWQNVQGKALREVVFKNGKLVFGYTSGRKDLTGGSALTSLSLLSATDTVKKITFVQNNSRYNGTPVSTTDTTLRYRLTLRSVNVIDPKTAVTAYKYGFSYLKEDTLPVRTSTAQDLYGLPNGKGGKYLLTSLEDEYPTLNYYALGYERRYGNRKVDTNYISAGLLSKVVYPTGGYDSIIYDWNRKQEQYIVYHYKDFGFDQCAPTSAGISDSSLLTIPFNQTVNIRLLVTPREPGYEGHDETIFTIKLASNNQVIYTTRLNIASNDGELTKDLVLNAGLYKIVQRTEGRFICGYSNINYQDMPPDTLFRDAPIGGVSVSKIISTDPVAKNNTTKTYVYKDKEDGTHSTFPLVEDARYVYRNNVKRFVNCDRFTDCVGETFCTYLVHGNSMVQPESMIGGNFFYHRSVIEATTGPDSISRSVLHRFAYNETFIGAVENGAVIPNTPYGIYPDMLIGEISTFYYSYNQRTKQIIPYRKVDRTYTSSRSLIVNNFNVVQIYESPCMSTPVTEVERGAYNINSYPIFYQKNLLTAIYDTLYANTGHPYITNYTLNSYTDTPYTTLRFSASKNSKGEDRSQSFRYFFDEPSNGLYNPLLTQNKIVPIEVTESVNSKFTRRNNITYRYTDTQNKVIEPSLYLETTAIGGPVSVTEKTKFDGYGNVAEVRAKEQLTSFLWDYNSCNLIAAANNAAQQDIAYTSFEADGSGNWTISTGLRDQTGAITGKWSLNLGGASGMGIMAAGGGITKTGLDSTKDYILSYWTKNLSAYTISGTQGTPLKGKTVNGWTYFEHYLKGIKSVTVSGTNYIDELRLYPLNAQMTTYTYTPQVGVTSQCDANNQIMYYEYDGLGRLKLTKDQNGKILKQYEYQYQQ